MSAILVLAAYAANPRPCEMHFVIILTLPGPQALQGQCSW
jgi:hypothetical protein